MDKMQKQELWWGGGAGGHPLQGNVEINTQIKYNSVDLSFMKAVKK